LTHQNAKNAISEPRENENLQTMHESKQVQSILEEQRRGVRDFGGGGARTAADEYQPKGIPA